ncbi:MAG: two-component regulator propeller domain-containing protein [Bacteroidota bacterium]|nr:two-component regulator propeller domain-containing protein [Bacteroidota bacterium]
MKKSLYNNPYLIAWIFLLIGSNSTLFAQDNWINYTTDNTPMSDHQINDILIVDGIKWVGTNWGLFSFDNTTWSDYSAFLPNNQVQSLVLDNNGHLYVSTLGGITIFDGSNWEQLTPQNTPLPSHINELVFDQSNVGFIGTINGLYKKENDLITLLLDSSSLEPDFVNISALAFKGDSLCIGTVNGGLGYWYNDSISWYNTTNGLIDNTANDLLVKDQNLWISCPYGGLTAQLTNGSFLTFNTGFFPNWPSNSLTTLQLDEQLIYVGTIAAGFFEFSFQDGIHNTSVYNTQNSELINNTVLCFEKGDDGYWIGTEGGLVNWNKSSSVNDDVINRTLFNVYENKIILYKDYSFAIFSLDGKKLMQSKGQKQINIGSLSKGLYILSIDSSSYLVSIN